MQKINTTIALDQEMISKQKKITKNKAVQKGTTIDFQYWTYYLKSSRKTFNKSINRTSP